jgi:mannose PTS system EIID component
MMDMSKSQEKVTSKDIRKIFWRMQWFQVSWNYERMQCLSFLYCLKPILKKIYKNSSKEEKAKVIKRHLEFFNTMPTIGSPILGITAAMEEKGGNDVGQAISSIKVGLMGPLAGLGDSIIWLTWMPICMSLGAAFASQGNPLGLILALLMFNAVNIPLKYYGIRFGYEKGVSLLENIKDSSIIQRYTTMASILGLVIIGGLIPQMVAVKIPLTFTINEVKVVIQQILDSIMPGLIPLIVTFVCYRYLKKGKNPIIALLIIVVLSVVFTSAGVIG